MSNLIPKPFFNTFAMPGTVKDKQCIAVAQLLATPTLLYQVMIWYDYEGKAIHIEDRIFNRI